MRIKLEAPSKTFLTGEYSVLVGGPALILNTLPKFELHVESSADNKCQGIHPMSPAGKWLRMRSAFYKNLNIHFVDPWKGAGGFGASGAQFLFIHSLGEILQGHFPFVFIEEYLEKLHRDFRSLYDDEGGSKPSGVDVLSMFLGRIASIEGDRKFSSLSHWPFENKNFMIFKTGIKVNTHESTAGDTVEAKKDHLESLKYEAKKSITFFENQQWTAFADSIRTYQEKLKTSGWLHAHTKKIIDSISSWPEVNAVKGCGAMGSDTLVILCDDTQTLRIKEKMKIFAGLEYVADKMKLSTGWEFNFSNEVSTESSSIFFADSIQVEKGVRL